MATQDSSLNRTVSKWKSQYGTIQEEEAARAILRDRANATQAYQQPIIRPVAMQDIMLLPGERGLILGMTREGKSTLAEVQIDNWYTNYDDADILILDSKPRFRAAMQLNGLPAKMLYRNWDYGTEVPNSVVIPLRNIDQEIKHAWSLGYRIIIAQIPKRSEIPKLDYAIHSAYNNRRKGRKLFIYVDELNNFFKIGVSGVKAGNGIIMAITSGGEKSTAFLGAGQRPRNISVESLESMTKLYWFYTPFAEDNKHLRSMDLPMTAQPPGSRSYAFYFFNRLNKMQGMVRVKPVSVKPRQRKGSKGWITYG